MNYNIHDKEMTAIVQVFKEWEPLLKSCQQHIIVWMDHKNLEYFTTTKTLIRHQARWAEFVAVFDFIVKYRPGEKNRKPDALSRHWDHRPEGRSEDLQPIQLLFKPGQLQISIIRVVQLKDTFKQELRNAGKACPSWVATRDAVVERKKKMDKNFSVKDGLLLWKSRWFIPEDKALRTKILRDNHDSQIAGHFGIHKTLEQLKHNYH